MTSCRRCLAPLPDHKHARDLTPPLRRAGAQNIGEVLFQTPVQQVQIVDDARNLIEPIPSPGVAVSAFVTAAAAQRPVLALHCLAPRGTYVLGFGHGTGQAVMWFTTAAIPSGLGAEAVPTDLTGARWGQLAGVNTIAAGDTPDVALPLATSPIQIDATVNGINYFLEPLYVTTGRFFLVMGNTVATNVTLQVAWREVL